MCLYNHKLIKPEEDIVCYKVARRRKNDKSGRYYAPFRRGCAYRPESTKYADPKLSPEVVEAHETAGSCLRLEEGVLHTFKDEHIALEYMAKLYDYYKGYNGGMIYAVLECTIPADAEYVFEGFYDSTFYDHALKCYGSSKLNVGKEIASYGG
jgi:hypothetical protein